MSDNTITLYPSNWLYNASVIGFLKVVEYLEKKRNNQFVKYFSEKGLNTISFREDYINELFSQVEIDSKCSMKLPLILKEYVNYIYESEDENKWNDWIKDNKAKNEYLEKYMGGDFSNKYIYAGNNLFGKGKYQNLVSAFGNSKNPVQDYEWLNPEQFPKFVERIKFHYEENINNDYCFFCNRQSVKKALSDLEKKLMYFQLGHNSLLGPSKNDMPNSYWNLEQANVLCHFCAYLILHHHIPFVKIGNQQIFINAPSFELMWHLNNYAATALSTNFRDVMAISLMEASQKINTTLGRWSMMNIEMIIKTKDSNKESIDYYSLSENTTALLLNKKISSLIKAVNEPYILERVLDNDFEELNNINNHILRILFNNNLTDNDLGKKDKNPILYNKFSNRSNHKREIYHRLSEILPELYVEIKRMK